MVEERDHYEQSERASFLGEHLRFETVLLEGEVFSKDLKTQSLRGRDKRRSLVTWEDIQWRDDRAEVWTSQWREGWV